MIKSTFFNYLYFLQSPQGVLGVGLAAPPLNGFQTPRVLTRWRWAAHTVTPLEGLQVIPTALNIVFVPRAFIRIVCQINNFYTCMHYIVVLGLSNITFN